MDIEFYIFYFIIFVPIFYVLCILLLRKAFSVTRKKDKMFPLVNICEEVSLFTKNLFRTFEYRSTTKLSIDFSKRHLYNELSHFYFSVTKNEKNEYIN